METYEIVFEVRTPKQWSDPDIDTEAIDEEFLGRFTPFFAENCEWAVVHFYGNPANTGYMLAENPEDEIYFEEHGVHLPDVWALHIVAKGSSPKDFVASLGGQYPDMKSRIRCIAQLGGTEDFQVVITEGDYHWAPPSRSRSGIFDYSTLTTSLRLSVFDPVEQVDGAKMLLTVSPEVYASYATKVCSEERVEVEGNTYKSACFIGEEPEFHNRIYVEDRTSLGNDDWKKKWTDVSLILDPTMLMATARVTPRYDQRLLTA